jgi:CubicO group peptidase (beta-lactamase class C family)
MLLVAVTGRSIADYVERAYGGLNAIARDYAKIGELYRLNGKWDGKQIISESWVRASVTPDAPHLMPGDVSFGSFATGVEPAATPAMSAMPR